MACPWLIPDSAVAPVTTCRLCVERPGGRLSLAESCVSGPTCSWRTAGGSQACQPAIPAAACPLPLPVWAPEALLRIPSPAVTGANSVPRGSSPAPSSPQFFSDVREAAEALRKSQEAMRRKFACDRSVTVTRLEDLLQDALVSVGLTPHSPAASATVGAFLTTPFLCRPFRRRRSA